MVVIQYAMFFDFIFVHLANDMLQGGEEFLPAVVCAFIRCLLIGTEAGLLHTKVSAISGWSQGPEHNPLQTGSGIADAPAIGELLQGIDDEDLAVDNAVPGWLGFVSELEFASDHWREIIVHHPLCEQGTFRERTPEFLWWVREHAFDDEGAGSGNCLGR